MERMPNATAELTDTEAVDRVRSGDTDAYEVIMRRYNQRLFRVARAILRSDADAEDALQNAYVQAYLHLDQFEGSAAFPTWLTRIAIREALALRRARAARSMRREENPTMRSHSSTDDPEHDAIRSEMRAAIEHAVEKLPEPYRMVFVLREVQELSTAETADALEITEENVKIRLHRSRALLRRALYTRASGAVSKVYAFDGARCDRIVHRVLGTLERLKAKQRAESI
jgi:RNA polymerase sigma-70 factor (ECF subfamily)